MSARFDGALSHHPAPQRDRVTGLASAFGIFGGPAAWFLQLCAGFVMSTWPCFPGDARERAPLAGYGWTGTGVAVLTVAGVAISVAALEVARRAFLRTRAESAGGHRELAEIGAGRTRFLALWGVVFGATFALATALTAIALLVLPRCDG